MGARRKREMEARIEAGGLIPPVIQCDRCGKRKKVQRLGKRFGKQATSWRCSACRNAQIPKIQIACFWCEKTIEIRRSKVDPSHYFLCGRCLRVDGTKAIDGFQKPGQVMVHKTNAAGEMTGFDIRYPTPDEAASMERARAIRDAAFGPGSSGDCVSVTGFGRYITGK